MLAIINSVALQGLEPSIISIEVDVNSGTLPAFDIVGLPDVAVKEARNRVRSAIKNSHFKFPNCKITVNLAPADLKKEGSSFDLPIALGILAATDQVCTEIFQNAFFVGELGLDGIIRQVPGVLPMTELFQTGKVQGEFLFVIPLDNKEEASLAQNTKIVACQNLSQVIEIFESDNFPYIEPLQEDAWQKTFTNDSTYDFAHVAGQNFVRRGLEIAAAGNHNVLMMGSPGSGKTLMARCFPGILPDLSFAEAIEITKIYSLCGLLKPHEHMINQRPFRSPHHTSSSISIVGGGRNALPGEITLASGGVLFLDELPEFRRDVLEALRQPLEDRIITIARVAARITYPANLLLVASCNPCPCGYFGAEIGKECTCTTQQIRRYRSKMSGPLLDRIDIQLDVPRVPIEEVKQSEKVENSATIKARVNLARARQRERYHAEKITYNAQLNNQLLKKYCQLDQISEQLLEKYVESQGLSMRAYTRIIKLARTIADLAARDDIVVNDIAEAIQYRNLDRYLE